VSTAQPTTGPRARRAPTQERSRRTVGRILDATEQLIGEAGVEAATTRAIAEQAGVAPASLYRFFADRDEIFDALLRQIVAEFDERAVAAEATWQPNTLEELIGLVLDLHVECYEARPTAAALWFGGRVSPAVAEVVHARNQGLAVRLRRLTVDLLPAPSDPTAAPSEFLSDEADLLVELGDRVLERAFRDGPSADRRVITIGREAIAAAAARLVAGVG
jgi:AcrR family transcriptional regulator